MPLARIAMLFKQRAAPGGGLMAGVRVGDPADPQYLQHVLGRMDRACEQSGGLQWAEERLIGSGLSHARPKFGNCCKSVKVRCPARAPPAPSAAPSA